MLKLLTDTALKGLIAEYKSRRAVMILVSASIVVAVGIIGLSPSYMLSSSRLSQAEERAKTLEETTRQSGDQEYLLWLHATNRKLELLDPTLDTDRPSLAIETLLENRPDGIRITGISWKWAEGGPLLDVEGEASTRQGLIEFESTLRDGEEFSNVSLPVSNLAKERDLNFQIKLQYEDQ